MRRMLATTNVGTLLRPVKVRLDGETLQIGSYRRQSILNNDVISCIIVHLHLLKTITAVKLINCDIKGAQLARLITAAPLTDVSLASCIFNDESVLHLAYHLPSSHYLKKIAFAKCDIGDVGVFSLLKAFEMQRYKEISLVDNHRVTQLGYGAVQLYRDTAQQFHWTHHVITGQFTIGAYNVQQILPLDVRKIMQHCISAQIQRM